MPAVSTFSFISFSILPHRSNLLPLIYKHTSFLSFPFFFLACLAIYTQRNNQTLSNPLLESFSLPTMSGLLKKRSREEEPLPNSPKRFHGRTEQQNLHILEDFEVAENFQETEEKCCVSEEAVSAVLRGLEEEIGVTSSSTSGQGFSGLSSEDDSLSSDMTSGYGTSEGGIDLCYLVGASDDELGIPPTPLFNLEEQGQGGFPSEEEDSAFSSDFAENAELKGFLEKWHFENDFVDCTQFSFIEDTAATAWDDMVSQGLFVDGDYSQSWGLETAGDI